MVKVTYNPSDTSKNLTLSEGNLTAISNSSSWVVARATEGKTTGKWHGRNYSYSGIATRNGYTERERTSCDNDYVGLLRFLEIRGEKYV